MLGSYTEGGVGVPDKEPYFFPQKCTREIIGRVMCEFDNTPVIRLKGLCEGSTIDRSFQLIDPSFGESKYYTWSF